jgi:hypothetical protein
MHIAANLATDTSAVKSALLKNPAPPAPPDTSAVKSALLKILPPLPSIASGAPDFQDRFDPLWAPFGLVLMGYSLIG